MDKIRVGGSPDSDGGAFPYQRVKSGGIPVRKPDTAMASGPADGIGDEGKVVEVIGALPALEDAEIVAEPWEWHSPSLNRVSHRYFRFFFEW